ncbi:MAG TPA: protein-glutamate O-methyltransferase CheR [Geobacterales bacterium]|nr:protein-glutamate O-methyltransferase CheR [Geobacterales bacterium]
MEPRCQGIPPEEFRLLREFVASRFGIVIDDNRSHFLADRLSPRLRELGLSSFGEYYRHLKSSPHSADEFAHLITLITNNETYFFREDGQLRVFAQEVLPELRRLRAKERRLRIVSAGCSSGEEPYTLAMLLVESGLFSTEWDLQIIGVDLDPQILGRANRGLYGQRSFQVTPQGLRERYFRPRDDGWQVRDLLARLCQFRQGNILGLPTVVQDEVDVLFCRNVLIYFTEEALSRAIGGFSSLLAPHGSLFLGHAETLSRIRSDFVPHIRPGAVVYRRGGYEE